MPPPLDRAPPCPLADGPREDPPEGFAATDATASPMISPKTKAQYTNRRPAEIHGPRLLETDMAISLVPGTLLRNSKDLVTANAVPFMTISVAESIKNIITYFLTNG
ncbi:MAG: hypothetical protein ABIP48_24725 [Planctomycetota bacterium]